MCRFDAKRVIVLTMQMESHRSRGDLAADLALVLAAIAAAWALSRWVIYPALGIPDYAPYVLRPQAALFGVVHGIIYLLSGRNLWPVVVLHAVTDSVAFWSVYRS